MTDRDWNEMASAFALGALDASDKEAFNVRLESDPALQQLVAFYERVLGDLATVVPRQAPPSGLRARILSDAKKVVPIDRKAEAISGDQVESSAEGLPPVAGGVSAETSKSETSKSSPIAPSRPERGGVLRYVPWVAAAASLVVAVTSWSDAKDSEDARGDLEIRLQQAEAEVSVQDSLLNSFLGDRVHMVTLNAGDGSPAARVFWNHTEEVYLVATLDLPTPEPGMVYQLWGIADGSDPISMGTFVPGQGAAPFLSLDVPQELTLLDLVQLAAITLEPAGGSPQPTQAPAWVGSWIYAD